MSRCESPGCATLDRVARQAAQHQRSIQPATPPTSPATLAGLTNAQYAFCLHYVANGFNASAAYRSAHPGVTNNTARVEGHKTLTNPDIKAHLATRLSEHWASLHMHGDEVLGRVAMDARADLTQLYDLTTEELLPMKEWPESVRNSIETFERTGDGGVKIKLVSKGQARRTILEQTGMLKQPLDGGLSALARAIREDLGEADN